MNTRTTYGQYVERTYTEFPVSAVESVTVSAAKIIVILKTGAAHTYRAGDFTFTAWGRLAKSLGKGQVLAGRNGCLAYGNAQRQLGKHARVA